jgi:cytochrome c peroxidase
MRGSSLTAAELAQFAPLPARMLDGASVPTDTQVDLGRVLFYETLMSGGHNVSCNSCHALNGFGADGRPRSFGDHGQNDSGCRAAAVAGYVRGHGPMRAGSPECASTLQAWVDTAGEEANSLQAHLSNRSVTGWTRED